VNEYFDRPGKSTLESVFSGQKFRVPSNLSRPQVIQVRLFLLQTLRRRRPAVSCAFEPEPFNFSILQQTAQRAEFIGKIVPMQCAVGAANGTVDLWINLSHHADHRVITTQFQSEHPGSAGVSAPLVSIDSFLESQPGSVSFVKIDVQGYELAVCQGMQDTLRQNPDISIVLEFMTSAMRELGFDPSHLIGFFIERGFEIYVIHPQGKLTRGMPTVIKDSSYFDLLFSRHPIVCERKTE
jgi:FkbM family methyltransferase